MSLSGFHVILQRWPLTETCQPQIICVQYLQIIGHDICHPMIAAFRGHPLNAHSARTMRHMGQDTPASPSTGLTNIYIHMSVLDIRHTSWHAPNVSQKSSGHGQSKTARMMLRSLPIQCFAQNKSKLVSCLPPKSWSKPKTCLKPRHSGHAVKGDNHRIQLTVTATIQNPLKVETH